MSDTDLISRTAISLNNVGVSFLEQGCYTKAIEAFLSATRLLHRAIDPEESMVESQSQLMEKSSFFVRDMQHKGKDPDTCIRDLTSISLSTDSFAFDVNLLYAIRICDIRTLYYHSHTIQAAILVINLGIAHLYAASITSDSKSHREHLAQSSAFFRISLKTFDRLQQNEDDVFLIRQIALYKMVALNGILFVFPNCVATHDEFDSMFELVEQLNEHISCTYMSECAAAA